MRAMLFAAGLGTRLRPLTDTMPKALVPVAGRPLLEHTLHRLIDAGATEVVVNIHHFGEQIIQYLSQHDFGIEIRISDEREALLDTGGGLRQALSLFSSVDSPILIHNVDIFSNANLADFYAHQHKHDVVLLVSKRETQRYLLFDHNRRMVGWTNVATGEVRTPFPHLNPADCEKLAFAGIHGVSPRISSFMEHYPQAFPIMQFYIENCDKLDISGVIQSDLHLLDVGKQNSLVAAESFLKELENDR